MKGLDLNYGCSVDKKKEQWADWVLYATLKLVAFVRGPSIEPTS